MSDFERLINSIKVYLASENTEEDAEMFIGPWCELSGIFVIGIDESKDFRAGVSDNVFKKLCQIYELQDKFEPYLADSYDEYIDEIGLRNGVEKLYGELLELMNANRG